MVVSQKKTFHMHFANPGCGASVPWACALVKHVSNSLQTIPSPQNT